MPGFRVLDDSDVRVRDAIPSLFYVLYIYPVSPRLNCSGTVSAVRFCYFDNSFFTNEQLIFTLLSMERSGGDFEITKVVNVRSTPRLQICTERFIIDVTVVMSGP